MRYTHHFNGTGISEDAVIKLVSSTEVEHASPRRRISTWLLNFGRRSAREYVIHLLVVLTLSLIQGH